ncbi:acyl-ACP--UDP-N-acetylglucosamine O-acyltransferase [Bacteroidetes/Chlorobi group bacterium ChocPot_Mid]|jgi:UDP-N-acetylglucosamine acyltransferase|nr:MAG: acyl-ACP--UDP-N-acetylglucosamine O-acyltransferase [Bacteroidetes/Chlorobi group bacterium ChocPot_Mid]
MNIHPTAIVSKQAKIGENVTIGAFTIIEDDVEIGNGTTIRSNVVLANGARIGKDVLICNGAVIATEPQDLKFGGEKTYAYVGDRTVIREYATINRGTHATGKAVVGEDCFIMAYCHVAHDCVVGNHVIMANATQLAGHVHVDDWVTIGGVVKIHQFCRVGCHSMLGADVKIAKDVPPYTLVGSIPAKIDGINKIGLKRRGFSSELIAEIDEFYKTILHSGYNTNDGIKKFLERNHISDEVKACIKFIEESQRGIYR